MNMDRKKTIVKLLEMTKTRKMIGKKVNIKALVNVQTKVNMKKSMKVNMNMNETMDHEHASDEEEDESECEHEGERECEYVFQRESHDERRKCQTEAEYDAASGNEMLSICWRSQFATISQDF